MAGRAAGRCEQRRPAVDRRNVGRGQRRESGRRHARRDQPGRRQLGEPHRAGLRRHVRRQRADVAVAELVDDAVEVAVHADARDLDALHAELVVAGAAHEVAHEGDDTLPFERLDDQIGVDPLDPRVHVVGGVGGDALGTEADALRGQVDVDDGVGPDRRRARGRDLRRERLGHLLGEALFGAEPHQGGRLPLDEVGEVAEPLRIAYGVIVDSAAAVVERLAVALRARLGVRARGARRRVVEPLVGAVQVRAREPRVAAAVADVRARAVELVELRAEQVVATVEGGLEALERVGDGEDLRHRAVLGLGHLRPADDPGLGRPAGDDRLRRSFGGVGVSVRLALTACEYTCGDEEREFEEGSAAHDCLLTGVKVTECDPAPVLGPSRLGSSAYGGAP